MFVAKNEWVVLVRSCLLCPPGNDVDFDIHLVPRQMCLRVHDDSRDARGEIINPRNQKKLDRLMINRSTASGSAQAWSIRRNSKKNLKNSKIDSFTPHSGGLCCEEKAGLRLFKLLMVNIRDRLYGISPYVVAWLHLRQWCDFSFFCFISIELGEHAVNASQETEFWCRGQAVLVWDPFGTNTHHSKEHDSDLSRFEAATQSTLLKQFQAWHSTTSWTKHHYKKYQ